MKALAGVYICFFNHCWDRSPDVTWWKGCMVSIW